MCTRTPQDRVPEMFLAMASTESDEQATFSEYGGRGDLFAPGSLIVSASHGDDTGSVTMSGTSMASPHIADAEALYPATDPTATDARVQAALLASSVAGRITDAGAGTTNQLLQVGRPTRAPPATAPVRTVGPARWPVR